MTATHEWLDLRVPFDDAARQQSLPLLDRISTALRDDAASCVTIIDIGAGTGNSTRWFQQHLVPRLPEQNLRWVLVDADQAALELASSSLPGVETRTAGITQLPEIVNALLATQPGRLLITGSAVLDVFRTADVAAIIETLEQHDGLGLLLLSITGRWWLTPADEHDEMVHDAFCGHQQRDGKLGPTAPDTLCEMADTVGARVETVVSQWQLAGPQDQAFIERFLSERVDAAIEHQPDVEPTATAWLERRVDQAAKGLKLEVEHLDVALDARGAHSR